VGQASDGRELVAAAKRLNPDIAIVDIGMPELNGIEATRQLAGYDSALRIIILTQQLDRSFLKFAFSAGAHGFVAKQTSSDELLSALEMVLKGNFYVTPLVAGSLRASQATSNAQRSPAEMFAENLTSRQREVLQLIAEGKTAKEIAVALGISTKTAEFHRGAIMDELGLRTTAELTRYALSAGIVFL
jgi:DNA-binding NarL/FixJ family response regulator